MKSVRSAFTAMMGEVVVREKKLAVATHLPIKKLIPLLKSRRLAEAVTARVSAPSSAISAMDGYGVRYSDLVSIPITLPIVGVSQAGKAFDSPLPKKSAIKIFTGAVVPKNVDAIVILEDAKLLSPNKVMVNEPQVKGRYIRPEGLDFKKGDVLLAKNTFINSRAISLIMASGVEKVYIRQRPKVAILSTGDELQTDRRRPLKPAHIFPTNGASLYGLLDGMAEVMDLGVAKDNKNIITKKLLKAIDKKTDLIITTGGASVGERDVIKETIIEMKGEIDFWKIAMRPGKPIFFGKIKSSYILGLPGNPASAIITALLFAVPMIKKMAGQKPVLLDDMAEALPLATPLGQNNQRQDYMRAKVKNGFLYPYSIQDSSMLHTLYDSDGVIVRPPHDGAKKKGDEVNFVSFQQFCIF